MTSKKGVGDETIPVGGVSGIGATIYTEQVDEAELRKVEADVALEWKPGDVILGIYEVRRVTEGFGEAAEERDFHDGGYGRVYKVFHRGWNRELAVKTPRAEAYDSEAKKANFLRECEAWSELGFHPHVASCFYVRELGGVPRVFSDYAEAGTLGDWIKHQRLYEGGPQAALARMLDIAIQFAWGLHHAHEQGLVHQDVKPLNLLMKSDGTATVTDFGLARARALPEGEQVVGPGGPGTMMVTRAGGMTLGYRSPEQAAGAKLTRRTDIWSWGLSVLEMFQGGATWAAGELAPAALSQFLEHNGEEEGIPAMPEGVAELLRHCFRPNPNDRPHDMPEVTAELCRVYEAELGRPYPRPEARAAADSADSLNNRAVSMHDLGRLEDAERLWSEALKHDAAHLAATYNLGLLQWRQAKIVDGEVVRRLENVHKGQPTARATYLLAMVHGERADFEAAVAELERAASDSPEDLEIRAALQRLEPMRERGGRCLRTFEGHTDNVNSVCLSADGRYALSGSDDKTVRLWVVATGKCLRTFEGHTGTVNAVCLSADGRFALSGSRDKTIRLWDVATGRCLRTLEGHTRVVNAVCLSADGRFVLSGSWDETLRLWDVATGKCLRTFEGHTGWVKSVCLSADGRFALSGSDDDTLRLWDVATGRCVRTFEGHTEGVNSVCLSADGRFALSGSDDDTLRLWELATSQCFRTFKGHLNCVTSVVLSSDGQLALSASKDNRLCLWDVATSRCLRTAHGHTASVNSVCLGADGRFALSGSADKTLRLWHVPLENQDCASPELCRPVAAARAVESDAAFESEMTQAREALQQGTLEDALRYARAARSIGGRERDRRALDLWSELGRQCRRLELRNAWHERTFEFEEHRYNEVYSVCLSADGRFALSGNNHKMLRLWNVSTGKCLRTFEGHTDDVMSVCLSADGRFALSGSDDKTLRLWEVTTGKCLRTFEGHTDKVNSVCLSADGRFALSGGDDSTLRLWDVATGKCLRTFEGHTGWVSSVCLSTDGRFALSGSNHRKLHLWEVTTGKCLRTFEGHTHFVTSVCLTADGRFALSGSKDETLRLWDVATGKCLRTFEGDMGDVSSVCLSADARFVLWGGVCGSFRLWELDWELDVVEEPAASEKCDSGSRRRGQRGESVRAAEAEPRPQMEDHMPMKNKAKVMRDAASLSWGGLVETIRRFLKGRRKYVADFLGRRIEPLEEAIQLLLINDAKEFDEVDHNIDLLQAQHLLLTKRRALENDVLGRFATNIRVYDEAIAAVETQLRASKTTRRRLLKQEDVRACISEEELSRYDRLAELEIEIGKLETERATLNVKGASLDAIEKRLQAIEEWEVASAPEVQDELRKIVSYLPDDSPMLLRALVLLSPYEIRIEHCAIQIGRRDLGLVGRLLLNIFGPTLRERERIEYYLDQIYALLLRVEGMLTEDERGRLQRHLMLLLITVIDRIEALSRRKIGGVMFLNRLRALRLLEDEPLYQDLKRFERYMLRMPSVKERYMNKIGSDFDWVDWVDWLESRIGILQKNQDRKDQIYQGPKEVADIIWRFQNEYNEEQAIEIIRQLGADEDLAIPALLRRGHWKAVRIELEEIAARKAERAVAELARELSRIAEHGG